MKVLYRWLQDYITFDLPVREIAEKLGMLGLEVEKIEDLGKTYEGFLVGRVLSVEKHRNADNLNVCSVSVGGGENLTIVCGAPNVAAGQKVAVGRPGAIVPRNQHDPSGGPFELKRITIRGTKSDGMICSEYELGLGTDRDGIMVLDHSARVGMPLARHLGIDETVLTIEVTPNRPDWLGHIGIAREIGIVTGGRLKPPPVTVKETNPLARTLVSVAIEDRTNCRRFAIRVLRGVKVGPSPAWLQQRLHAIGLRPINNIVDVTNYVMFETGHPLHAFDLSCIRGGQVVVRRAKSSIPFRTLDGNEVTVPAGAVMVCDAEREVSIAGIMGGENSAVHGSTSAVVLEAANWNPSSVRRTARILGLDSNASYRFERGTDPNGVPFALNRAAHLIQKISGAEVLKAIVDDNPGKAREKRMKLRVSRVNQVLGTSLKQKEIKNLLRPLAIVPSRRKGSHTEYTVPTFRIDLEREIDLVEEVARVFGYDRIPESTLFVTTPNRMPASKDPVDRVRENLIGLGFHEAVTIPIQGTELSALSGKSPIAILNPLNNEMGTLRTSLLPGLLAVIGRNIRYGNSDLRIFEIGNVFCKDRSSEKRRIEDFVEEGKVAMAISGLATPRHWSEKERMADFYDMKGDVSALLESLSLDKCRFISYSTSDSLVEAAIRIETNGSGWGLIGSVRDQILRRFGIEQPVFVAEMEMEFLRTGRKSTYRPLPKFPRVNRDVAFVVDKTVSAEMVEEVLLNASSGLLKRAELFDLYEGAPLEKEKRSLAFALEIVPVERTLTDREIEDEVRRVIAAVTSRFGAELRA